MRLKIILLGLFLMGPAVSAAVPSQGVLQPYYRGEYRETISQLKNPIFADYRERHGLLGLSYLQLGETDKAWQAISQVKVPRAYSDYLDYIKVQYFLKTDQLKQIRWAIRRIQSGTAPPFVVIKIRLQLLEYYLDKKDYTSAQKLVDLLDTYEKNDVVTSRILKGKVALALATKKQTKVLKAYGRLIQLYPKSDPDQRLWHQITGSFSNRLAVSDTFNSLKDHVSFFRNLFGAQEYKRAIVQGEYIAVHYPRYQKLGEIYGIMGMAYFNQYAFGSALRNLKKSLDYGGRNRDKMRSQFFIARILDRTKEYSAAIAQYKFFIKKNQYPRFEPEAYYYLIKLLKRFGPYSDYKSRLETFRRIYGRHYLYKTLAWENDWDDV